MVIIIIGVIEMADDVNIIGCPARFGCGKELAEFHVEIAITIVWAMIIIIIITVGHAIVMWGRCGELWGWVALHTIHIGLWGGE